MTHVVNAVVVALGFIFVGRGFPRSQVSAVEQADDTGAEKPPTNDTHMELVSHPVAVPVSTRSSARLAEQSRKRSAGDIKQNRQATLRRRRESVASTGLYAQLRE
uniref:Secreted protein n=1 Tax=Micromonas pusilla TaxID=38833 RepID=A0A7S0KW01_MICPS|mmetsp:Transcript_648/g.2276  ORF Transcript_648/g.2276 Transcript_648/m.2276 type:complete len:105 (+) Transcript_648:2631-2945(+)